MARQVCGRYPFLAKQLGGPVHFLCLSRRDPSLNLHHQFRGRLPSPIRKVTKAKSIFPTPEAVRKLLFLANRDILKKWTMPIQNWPLDPQPTGDPLRGSPGDLDLFSVYTMDLTPPMAHSPVVQEALSNAFWRSSGGRFDRTIQPPTLFSLNRRMRTRMSGGVRGNG